MPEGVSCSQVRNIPDPENAVKENLRVPTLMGMSGRGVPAGLHNFLLHLKLRFQNDGIENPSFLRGASGSLVNNKDLTFRFK